MGDTPSADAAPLLVPDEETTRAALRLLNDAVTVQLDGRHHVLLRALRHTKDPSLTPLFAGLAEPSRHPSLRVHGLLGLAEVGPEGRLGLGQIAEVEQPNIQAELISAALDGGLIDHDTAWALLGWAGLDPSVKLLLAMPHVASGRFDAASPGYADLVLALDHPAPGQRGLAALLLHETGDARGTAALYALCEPTNEQAAADPICAMLLETAWTHGLRRSADWAFAVAQRETQPERVEMLALKTAIRFGAPGAENYWAAQLAEAQEPARRTRLALIGLEAAPWLDAARFAPLIESADTLESRVGHAAAAVSQRRPDAGHAEAAQRAVADLLDTGHPQAWSWAGGYAEQTGAPGIARVVVLGYEAGEARGRSRRLEAVAQAAQTWVRHAPNPAVSELAAALTEPDADPLWRRAVLLGLIREPGGAPPEVAAAVAQPLESADRETQALVLILGMRRDGPMSEDEQDAFELLVQGGVEIADSLRVQTAWAYLRKTGQGPGAIAALLAPSAVADAPH